MNSFNTLNPVSGEILKSYQHWTWPQAEQVLLAAQIDFEKWRKTSFAQRSELMNRLAQVLRAEKHILATSMNQEMGKLPGEALAEVEKCASTCEFYADQAESILKNHKIEKSPYTSAEVSFQPLGVILGIMPWNFPLWQVLRFAAPTLMAGNVIVLKHSDLTAGTAQHLARIFNELSPDFQLLHNAPVDHEVAAQMIAAPQVRAVTFTGSSRGGRAVAMTAAKNLKKVVLELGGSDAYLILEDADIERAAKLCAQSRLVNCGQSCVAGKRFIVCEKVAADFIAQFSAALKETPLAPLASQKFQAQIIAQVEKLKSWGGQIVLGGSAPQGPGAFYPATLVVFEKHEVLAHNEEIFGPVASVFIVKDRQQAVQLANSSVFGLGGGIFTRDLKAGKELIEKELEAGFVVLNDFVKSDAHLPFGGIKESGYGRELGTFGLMEFVNIKTVAVHGSLP